MSDDGTGRSTRGPGPAALVALALALWAPSAPARAADVLVVGDVQYRPVAEVVAALRVALPDPPRVVPTAEAHGRLARLVTEEQARVVVALGRSAVDEAVTLPPPTVVVYGLVILPPAAGGPNVTGVYMATPVREYVNVLRRYLPSIKRLAVVGSADLIQTLDGREPAQAHVEPHQVASPSELVAALDGLADAQAVLLLPDVALITGTVMDRAHLFSFRRNVPLLGISEGNVRQGSLFALVFEPSGLGRQIAERVLEALGGRAVASLPAAPPRAFELCVNVETARRLGIAVPEEMLRVAKRTYP